MDLKLTHTTYRYRRYKDLDNYQTGIHDYFKYLKYGFGRATDILNSKSEERISRIKP